MTLITKGMGKILEKLGGSERGKPHSTRAGRMAAGSRRLKRGFKEISTPWVDETVFIKQFKKMKKDKVTPELTGLLTGIKNISKDQSKLGKGKERTRKSIGGFLKGAKAIASKVFNRDFHFGRKTLCISVKTLSSILSVISSSLSHNGIFKFILKIYI